MNSSLRSGFTLGEFRILPLQGKVEGPDGDRHIQPKAVYVLICLAEAEGEIVEREQFFRDVWGGTDGHDEALTHAVSQLRHALDDDAEEPLLIKTVPRRGYRLLVEPLPLEPDAESDREPGAMTLLWEELKQRKVIRVALGYAAISWLLLQFADILFDILNLPEFAIGAFLLVLGVGFLLSVVVAWLFQVVPEHEEEHDQRRRFKNAIDITVIVVLTFSLGLLGYLQLIRPPTDTDISFPRITDLPTTMTAPEPTPRSVAVLRFANFGGDSVFSNGLSEHLLNLLAKTGQMRVPSRQITWMLSDQQMLARAANDWLEAEEARDAKTRDLTVGEAPAREIRYKDGKGRPRMVRFVLGEDYLYGLASDRPPAAEDDPPARFLESFETW